VLSCQVVPDCGNDQSYLCSPQPYSMTVGISAASVQIYSANQGMGTPASIFSVIECKSPPYEALATSSCPPKFNTSAGSPGSVYGEVPSNGRNALGGQTGRRVWGTCVEARNLELRCFLCLSFIASSRLDLFRKFLRSRYWRSFFQHGRDHDCGSRFQQWQYRRRQ
jgi:hypothetical protein